jgi:hypothetical protein
VLNFVFPISVRAPVGLREAFQAKFYLQYVFNSELRDQCTVAVRPLVMWCLNQADFVTRSAPKDSGRKAIGLGSACRGAVKEFPILRLSIAETRSSENLPGIWLIKLVKRQ